MGFAVCQSLSPWERWLRSRRRGQARLPRASTQRYAPAFVRAMLSLCFCFSVAALPSQSRSARQLPQRGSHWRVGPLSADRWKFNMAQKIVPCYRDSQQLDKGYCPEVAALCSRALLFLIQINFARPAWALPARQWLSLWESWRVAPERATASASPAEPAPHRRDVRGGSWAGPGQPEAQGQAQRPPGAALRPSFRPRGRRWWAEGAAPAGA